MADGSSLPTLNPSSRREVEDAIELLIALLDMFDPDPDLEDGEDDEPYLASTAFEDKGGGSKWLATRIDTSDCELEDEHDEDSHDQEDDRSDLEPSLGWTRQEARTGEYPIGWNVNQDLEDEHDGREPDYRRRQTPLKIGQAPHTPKSANLSGIVGRYALVAIGSCMIPDIYDSQKVVCDTTAPLKAGEIVVVHLSAEAAGRWGMPGIVKRLVAHFSPASNVLLPYEKAGYLLEMNNPRRSFFLPEEDTLAVHRVVEVLPVGATHTADGEPLIKP